MKGTLAAFDDIKECSKGKSLIAYTLKKVCVDPTRSDDCSLGCPYNKSNAKIKKYQR